MRKYNKIIVYPNGKFIFSRRSGKTNLEFAIFTASLEATLTNKPVVVDYGMKLVDINDLQK